MAENGVTVSEICEALKGDGFEPLTKMSITGFVRDGMPKLGRGRYDPVPCMRWYIGRLRRSVQQRDTEGPDGQRISLDAVDIRLKSAKAESEEISLAERRGELIPLAAYVSEMSQVAVSIRQSILAIPNQIAADLTDKPKGEIKALLTKELKSALSQLAQKGVDRGETKSPKVQGRKPTPEAVAKLARGTKAVLALLKPPTDKPSRPRRA